MKTRYEKTKPNNSGSNMRVHRTPYRDINGNIDYSEELVNQYEMIQSYKEVANIHNIIAQFGGIKNIPQNTSGFGGSDESIPKTTRQLADMAIKVKKGWEQLPQNQKDYFHNSYENYLETLSNDEGLTGYVNVFGNIKKPTETVFEASQKEETK